MAKQYVVAREFRGATLFLVSVDRASALFDWSSDSSRARRFESMAASMSAASLAMAEYGALCVVRDAVGCLAQPAAAAEQQQRTTYASARQSALDKLNGTRRTAEGEPLGRASRSEFRRIVTAEVTAHGPHCDEHSGFTDGCSTCYSVHRETTI
jgi:hypothetical protein